MSDSVANNPVLLSYVGSILRRGFVFVVLIVTVFDKGCSNSYSHKQYVRLPVSSDP
jgi:hypothetical protein